MSGKGIYSNELDLKLGVAEGAELTPVMRGLYLKLLGLTAEKRIWETGRKQAPGYAFAAIDEAAARHLPPSPGEEEGGGRRGIRGRRGCRG